MHRCWSRPHAFRLGVFAFLCFTPAALPSMGDEPVPDQTDADPIATRSEPPDQAWREAYQFGQFQSASGGKLPYRLLKPEGPTSERPASDRGAESGETAGRRYPLVLVLHGAGERGADNEKQLVHAAESFARPDRRQQQPAYVLFPQCPEAFQWVDTPWTLSEGRGTLTDQPSPPLQLALELVDLLLQSLPIDPDRVYVTGLSMGGYGAWHAAGLRPNRFAALLVVCGGSDPTWAGRYRGLPVWCFHGDQDSVVPVVRGREMIAALALAGHQGELRYCEYAGVGHDSWTQTYASDEVHEWLFRQRRNRIPVP